MKRTHKRGGVSDVLSSASQRITEWVGSSRAFTIAVLVVLVWAVTGPLFHYSDTWQLVINTGTTVVTNELVAAMQGASNRLVDVENLSEEELKTLHRHYRRLAHAALRDQSLLQSHSVDEAESRHHRKMRHARKEASTPDGAKTNRLATPRQLTARSAASRVRSRARTITRACAGMLSSANSLRASRYQRLRVSRPLF